jgi:hypothetical protein
MESKMIGTLKRFFKGAPVVGPALVHLRKEQFKSSADYWDRRYRAGGNSGSGSYNRLAEFKANFLNKFIAEHQIMSVIEFGSGDGAQLKLARYPKYIGIDVSLKAVEMCRSMFASDTTKVFLQSNSVDPATVADLALSLDVIYHLVEDSVFETYMRQLFHSAQRFVAVYSSNMDQDSPAIHVRHRKFTQWVEQNEPSWFLHTTLKNAYPYDTADPEPTSFADFYVFARS